MNKLWARLRRSFHCLTHLHRAYDRYEEARFETPNRFGLRSVSHVVELTCECDKVFWRIDDKQRMRGPHD